MRRKKSSKNRKKSSFHIDSSILTRYNMDKGGDMMKLTLRQARLVREKTQDQMADILGVHVQTYRKIEENPEEATVKQAITLSKALAVPYEDIFFGGDSSLTGYADQKEGA